MPTKRKDKRRIALFAIARWTKEHMRFLSAAENRETFFERIERFLPRLDPRYVAIEKAYNVAEDAFLLLRRDSGVRYFEHLRAVALILVEYLEVRDYELIIAALLHDILEDIPEWNVQRLRNEFGDRVAQLVEALSQPKRSKSRTKEVAEKIYHDRLELAERDFFIIKLADRLHNLLTLFARPRHKQIEKIKETENHYMRFARKHLILLPELRTILKILKYQN